MTIEARLVRQNHFVYSGLLVLPLWLAEILRDPLVFPGCLTSQVNRSRRRKKNSAAHPTKNEFPGPAPSLSTNRHPDRDRHVR